MRITKLNPGMLAFAIVAYFFLFAGIVVIGVNFFPGLEDYLPMAGFDARELVAFGRSEEIVGSALSEARSAGRYAVALMLIAYLTCTVLTMVPVTWVYMATHRNVGFKPNFVVSLVVFPILTTSIVLLIQDSLSLAFGLAALVAAVRFRIRLRDTLDGIYIFAAISVGLSAGIGFVGVGVVTALFFSLVNIALWKLNFAAGGDLDDSEELLSKEDSGISTL